MNSVTLTREVYIPIGFTGGKTMDCEFEVTLSEDIVNLITSLKITNN